jgi:hypothetical protein
MTPLTLRTSTTSTTGRHRARKRRSLDAVVASYIRELATDPAPRPQAGRKRRP